ncbi:MAG: hypothetical protein AB1757_01865 [Acidobacteriota bacterium]
MKECPECHKFYPDTNRFCSIDGSRLVESVQSTADLDAQKEHRLVSPPPQPLPMRLTIIDQSDEGNRSRVIQGLVLDAGSQGLRIQTGTIETGELNIIRDHTVAFKNKLELEVELPAQMIKVTGFAAWYKPDGINWNVGVYIRDMSAADRKAYDEYLQTLTTPSSRVSSNA